MKTQGSSIICSECLSVIPRGSGIMATKEKYPQLRYDEETDSTHKAFCNKHCLSKNFVKGISTISDVTGDMMILSEVLKTELPESFKSVHEKYLEHLIQKLPKALPDEEIELTEYLIGTNDDYLMRMTEISLSTMYSVIAVTRIVPIVKEDGKFDLAVSSFTYDPKKKQLWNRINEVIEMEKKNAN